MEAKESKSDNKSLRVKPLGKRMIYLTLLPPILAIIAIFPLSEFYYQLLRITITLISAIYALREHEEGGAVLTGWVIIFTSIAILFNPVIRIHLIREVWIAIDILVAIIFLIYFWKLKKQTKI